MAKFDIEHSEGMHYVKATLQDEMIHAERGALCYMTGKIKMQAPLPTLRGWVVSALTDESGFRPSYTGTGEVFLESSFGGFHVFEIHDESWILDRGAYWASEGSVKLSAHREAFLTALFAGEGLIYLQTQVSGQGKVVLCSQGPVEEFTLNNEMIEADGNYVIARTSSISFKIKRTTRSILGAWTSGEGANRVYEGKGKVLVSSVPYWRYRMMQERQGLFV
jgi:uncharacterized protein (AIM24 family)